MRRGRMSVNWTFWDNGTLMGPLRDSDFIEKRTVSDVVLPLIFHVMYVTVSCQILSISTG